VVLPWVPETATHAATAATAAVASARVRTGTRRRAGLDHLRVGGGDGRRDHDQLGVAHMGGVVAVCSRHPPRARRCVVAELFSRCP